MSSLAGVGETESRGPTKGEGRGWGWGARGPRPSLVTPSAGVRCPWRQASSRPEPLAPAGRGLRPGQLATGA